jgi:hypothetical protein
MLNNFISGILKAQLNTGVNKELAVLKSSKVTCWLFIFFKPATRFNK